MLDTVKFYCPHCNNPFDSSLSVYKPETLRWDIHNKCKTCNLQCDIEILNDRLEDMIIDVCVFKNPNDKKLDAVVFANGSKSHELVHMEVGLWHS